MSFLDYMFWNTQVKCKKLDEHQIRATIPDTTNLWQPRFGDVQGSPAPNLFRRVEGDFQVWCKVSGKFLHQHDQAGLLIKENNKCYFRCGFEICPVTFDISESMPKDTELCVATNVVYESGTWDLTQYPVRVITGGRMSGKANKTSAYWFSVKRQGNVLVSYVSEDGKQYKPIRMTRLHASNKVYVGAYGASPIGKGIKVVFSDFELKVGRPDTADVTSTTPEPEPVAAKKTPEEDEMRSSVHDVSKPVTKPSKLLADDDSEAWRSDYSDEFELEKHYSDDEDEYFYSSKRTGRSR